MLNGSDNILNISSCCINLFIDTSLTYDKGSPLLSVPLILLIEYIKLRPNPDAVFVVTSPKVRLVASPIAGGVISNTVDPPNVGTPTFKITVATDPV